MIRACAGACTRRYFQTTAVEHQPRLTASVSGSRDEFASAAHFCPHVHCGKLLQLSARILLHHSLNDPPPPLPPLTHTHRQTPTHHIRGKACQRKREIIDITNLYEREDGGREGERVHKNGNSNCLMVIRIFQHVCLCKNVMVFSSLTIAN